MSDFDGYDGPSGDEDQAEAPATVDVRAPVEPPDFDAMTKSPRQREAYALAWRLANGWCQGRCHDVPILIQGETGTGKGWLTEQIHKWSGAKGEVHALNLGAINEGLADAELFGHEAGAFTSARGKSAGHLAHEGVILLDEVDKAPPALLVKLLRALRERTYYRVGQRQKAEELKALVVCAASRDLKKMVKRGEMLPDFYYRVAPSVIDLLPLRDRRCDIPALAKALAAERKATIDDAAAELLARGVWPGNVATLKGAIDSAWQQHGRLDEKILLRFVELEVDDREAAILRLIADQEDVTTRDVADLLGLSRSRTSTILNSMKRGKKIVEEVRDGGRKITWNTPDVYSDPEEDA